MTTRPFIGPTTMQTTLQKIHPHEHLPTQTARHPRFVTTLSAARTRSDQSTLYRAIPRIKTTLRLVRISVHLSLHRSTHRYFLQDHRIKKHKVTATNRTQSDTIKQRSRPDGHKKRSSLEKPKATSLHVKKKNGLSGQEFSSEKGQGQTGTSSVS